MLALFSAVFGPPPVKVTADDPQRLDPGLVLFAAFSVRGLATTLPRHRVASGG
jgi:hypothetical protein